MFLRCCKRQFSCIFERDNEAEHPASVIKDAEFINHPFQIWASSWLNCDDDSTLDSVSKFLWSSTEGIDPEFAGLFSSKEWANRISGMHMRGPVKHIDRAIAKVVLTGSVHSI
jgi:hypothetical protein